MFRTSATVGYQFGYIRTAMQKLTAPLRERIDHIDVYETDTRQGVAVEYICA